MAGLDGRGGGLPEDAEGRSRRGHAIRRQVACGLLTTLFMAIVWTGCGTSDGRPPGLRLLREKSDHIHLNMTVAEVDAVMAGLPRKERRVRTEAGTLFRDGLSTRPSVLNIAYDDKPGADEGDYVLTAYFDEDGRLVGVTLQSYWK